jgi:hypothetical protein
VKHLGREAAMTRAAGDQKVNVVLACLAIIIMTTAEIITQEKNSERISLNNKSYTPNRWSHLTRHD